MANVKNNSASQETRRRLLEAAGQVFSEHGFHLATIKDITDRAGASLASVNYHFQDKAELYAEVLRRLAEKSARIVPPDEKLTGDAASRLTQFILYFCTSMFGMNKPLWESVLMARELAEPTDALHPMYEQVVHPIREKMSPLMGELLGLPPTDPAVAFAAASVLGQCVYYMKNKNLLIQMHPQFNRPPDAEEVAAHVTAFSLGGIRELRSLSRNHRP